MFSKTKQKAKQIVQTHGVTIGVVTGAAATYAVMRKFDLDVAQVRKQAYEQGVEAAREAAGLEFIINDLLEFVEEKGLSDELAKLPHWTLTKGD